MLGRGCDVGDCVVLGAGVVAHVRCTTTTCLHSFLVGLVGCVAGVQMLMLVVILMAVVVVVVL